jgi:hypothetical protein
LIRPAKTLSVTISFKTRPSSLRATTPPLEKEEYVFLEDRNKE